LRFGEDYLLRLLHAGGGSDGSSKIMRGVGGDPALDSEKGEQEAQHRAEEHRSAFVAKCLWVRSHRFQDTASIPARPIYASGSVEWIF
jgi:hypothetical protein